VLAVFYKLVWARKNGWETCWNACGLQWQHPRATRSTERGSKRKGSKKCSCFMYSRRDDRSAYAFSNHSNLWLRSPIRVYSTAMSQAETCSLRVLFFSTSINAVHAPFNLAFLYPAAKASCMRPDILRPRPSPPQRPPDFLAANARRRRNE
jgi:hypothetical protein